MTKRKYTALSLSDKEKMFLEYKGGTISKYAISKKYGVTRNVLDRLIKKHEVGESFKSHTGESNNKLGRPRENFQTIEDELEYRRMAMAIEKKFLALKKLKSQINSD